MNTDINIINEFNVNQSRKQTVITGISIETVNKTHLRCDFRHRIVQEYSANNKPIEVNPGGWLLSSPYPFG